MNSAWGTSARVLTGIFITAVYATPQAYTISAKPGAVNYVEGNAFLDGRPISAKSEKTVFLNANDTISTDLGKAEVLLAPGVFLRVGDNTQVRMISPSLADTQLEIKTGEAMIEVDNLVKDSQVTVIDGDGTAVIDKDGLYRFKATEPRSVAVLEGKLQVSYGDRKSDLGKGHELILADRYKTNKFDTKEQDNLYAWSNVRAEYNAASSYQAARDVNSASYGGAWGGYGFSGVGNPGWMWNGGMNSWAWLPGNSAFFSPFGYGFYGPGLVAYAPVVYAPVYGGGYGYLGGGGVPVARRSGTVNLPGPGGTTRAVPVNPIKPPAIGQMTTSLAANQAARNSAARNFSTSGFRTAGGGTVSAGRAATMFGGAARGNSPAGFSGGGARTGGFTGGGRTGGVGGAGAAGGAHVGGGSVGGAAHR